MDDRGCDTCLHLDGMNGICRLGLADEWTVRSCDTSMCSKYEMDPFYKRIASEGCIYCGHKELKKMETLEQEESREKESWPLTGRGN